MWRQETASSKRLNASRKRSVTSRAGDLTVKPPNKVSEPSLIKRPTFHPKSSSFSSFLVTGPRIAVLVHPYFSGIPMSNSTRLPGASVRSASLRQAPARSAPGGVQRIVGRRPSVSGLALTGNLNPVSGLPKAQRTSKTTQKLVVLPSEPQTKPLPPPDEDDADIHGYETDRGVRDHKSAGERMSKAQREKAGFKRITAYCVADEFKTKLLANFLKREHNVQPRVFDEAMYVVSDSLSELPRHSLNSVDILFTIASWLRPSIQHPVLSCTDLFRLGGSSDLALGGRSSRIPRQILRLYSGVRWRSSGRLHVLIPTSGRACASHCCPISYRAARWAIPLEEEAET